MNHNQKKKQSTETEMTDLTELAHKDFKIANTHKKEQNCAICRDVDGPRVCHTE